MTKWTAPDLGSMLDAHRNTLAIATREPRPLTAEETERVVAAKLDRLARTLARSQQKSDRRKVRRDKVTTNGWQS